MVRDTPTGLPSTSAKNIKVRIQRDLQVIGHELDLRKGHGSEDRVDLLELVVQRVEAVDLLFVLLHVQRADREPALGLHARHDLCQPIGDVRIVHEPRDEVLPLPVAISLDELVVVREDCRASG